MGTAFGTRSLVGVMNFLMWFLAIRHHADGGIMGISQDIFEASEIDGCSSTQRFYRITLPLIRPILAYTLITSIIGGLQMFDVPQILTNGQGNPDPYLPDADYVPQQPLKMSKNLWYGRSSVCLSVRRQRHLMLYRILDDK